jgi:hypothetical protein
VHGIPTQTEERLKSLTLASIRHLTWREISRSRNVKEAQQRPSFYSSSAAVTRVRIFLLCCDILIEYYI